MIHNHFTSWITTSATTSTVAHTNLYSTSSGGTSVCKIYSSNPVVITDNINDFKQHDHHNRKLRCGESILLPCGSEIRVDGQGNWKIIDENAKVTYKANRVLEFNRYINASDLLEDFIKYLGAMGVKKRDIMKIDLGTFITWLIIAAAEQDGYDKPPAEIKMLEDHSKTLRLPHCKTCGRFISKKRHDQKIEFCNGDHMDRWLAKII